LNKFVEKCKNKKSDFNYLVGPIDPNQKTFLFIIGYMNLIIKKLTVSACAQQELAAQQAALTVRSDAQVHQTYDN